VFIDVTPCSYFYYLVKIGQPDLSTFTFDICGGHCIEYVEHLVVQERLVMMGLYWLCLILFIFD